MSRTFRPCRQNAHTTFAQRHATRLRLEHSDGDAVSKFGQRILYEAALAVHGHATFLRIHCARDTINQPPILPALPASGVPMKGDCLTSEPALGGSEPNDVIARSSLGDASMWQSQIYPQARCDQIARRCLRCVLNAALRCNRRIWGGVVHLVDIRFRICKIWYCRLSYPV